jgi:class 3 adenylate cyclase
LKHEKISPWTGEFTSTYEESNYRITRSSRDRIHIRVIWTLSIIFFALYAAPDLSRFGASANYDELAVLRLCIVAIGAIVALGSLMKRFGREADALTMFAFLLVSVCYAFLAVQRHDVDRNIPGVLLLVIGIYLFSPNRFLFNLLGGLFCSLIFVGISIFYTANDERWWAGYGYLVPANLLASFCLVRLNSLHRKTYMQRILLEEEVGERAIAQARLKTAHRQSHELLLNILPQAVVADLQRSEHGVSAKHFSEATVLFADIVNFTQLADSIDAGQLVDLLNIVFTRFDALAEQHALEKIKTVGDAYMAVSGVPVPQKDHLQAAARLALAMHGAMETLSEQLGRDLSLRIGLHTGSLVAGVIGRKKFAYDVWGRTVNLASRLEAQAHPGQTLLAVSTGVLLGDGFVCTDQGGVAMKGMGVVQTCILERALVHAASRRITSAAVSSMVLS